MCVCSAVSNSLQAHGLLSSRFLCPWNFPGKNTGAGCHVLLQGLFLTQGSNPRLLHLLHGQVDSSPFPWWLRQWRICQQCRRPEFSPSVRKPSSRREWLPSLVFLPGEFYGPEEPGRLVHGVAKSQTRLSN